ARSGPAARGILSMSDQRAADDAFAFTVIDDDGEEVVIEVSEEDYRREKTAGVEEESLLRPGRYRLKRGGFLARHPELKLKESRRA
ncbi:MAG TPA: hypothetical protein VF240_18095, partial [Pyrinomonadaceae bacterium]